MSIYTIRDNLIRTIEGKEAYLAEIKQARTLASKGEDLALYATEKFLAENIRELTVILKDVTECCVKATEASWIGVDRQGGI